MENCRLITRLDEYEFVVDKLKNDLDFQKCETEKLWKIKKLNTEGDYFKSQLEKNKKLISTLDSEDLHDCEKKASVHLIKDEMNESKIQNEKLSENIAEYKQLINDYITVRHDKSENLRKIIHELKQEINRLTENELDLAVCEVILRDCIEYLKRICTKKI